MVYCQEEGEGAIYESIWEGVHRVHIPVKTQGSAGSIIFDGKAAWHAAKSSGIILTLGYNTAFYALLYRLKGIPNVMNMDGIEWKRGKWSKPVQLWFWVNEHLGCRLANRLIADHPAMKKHLQRNVREDKITVSAYGAEKITEANTGLIAPYGITPKRYATLIARPEPENSVLEVVQAFSSKPRGIDLVVLGKYCTYNPYQKAVLEAASDEVKFLGAIYDKNIVSALRFYSLFYIHGHTVGGTNPSLLEALGAGNPVIAHDNRFNRWVGGKGASYFCDEVECDQILTHLLDANNAHLLEEMAEASRKRHAEAFEWGHILAEQEQILLTEIATANVRKDRDAADPARPPASTHSM